MPDEPEVKPVAEVKVVEISCPACKSRITSDGKQLAEKSSHLEKLEMKAERADELKADNATLKQKLADIEKELEGEKPEEVAAAGPKKSARFVLGRR